MALETKLISSGLNKKLILIIMLISLTAIFLGAIYTGYISPDSWNYLTLSYSVLAGNGCQVNGEYFAVFPCGYPILISLTSLISGLDVFISSKLLNLIFILSSTYLLYSVTKSLLTSFIYVVNPITLYYLQYTWSENAFILAITLVIYSLLNLYQGNESKRVYCALVVGLLLGVTSRYFFGPFAFIVFLITWAVLGRKVAVKTLPYFILSGVIFITYYFYNKSMTGYGSGMPRIPAPESILLLLFCFIKYTLKQVVLSTLCLVPILILAQTKIFKDNINSSHNKKLAFFLFSLGMSYLILSFILRAYSQYDLYGIRTVGFGFLLIFTSLIYIIFNNTIITFKHTFALFIIAVLSVVYTQRNFYLDLYEDAIKDDFHIINTLSNFDLVKLPDTAYSDGIEDDVVIVPFGISQGESNISVNSRLYYDLNYVAVSPKIAPYWEQENKDTFLSRLKETGDECYYDFTRIKNMNELDKILNNTYPVDISFASGSVKPELILKTRYDESLAQYFREIFVPGELVDCFSTNINS